MMQKRYVSVFCATFGISSKPNISDLLALKFYRRVVACVALVATCADLSFFAKTFCIFSSLCFIVFDILKRDIFLLYR